MSCKQNLFRTKWSMAIFAAIVILAGSALAVGQTERVVHRFQGGEDGSGPAGGLISDNAGNLYGTTGGGGAGNNGTVFELSPQDGHWSKTILYSFTGGNDGGFPFGELIFDQAGNLYGTTVNGGSQAGGTVFQLKPQGSTWSETVVSNFVNNPLVGGLVFDKAGNLYGATYNEGARGFGEIFQLTPLQGGGWTQTVIYSFNGHKGGNPLSGPIISEAGNLYGVLQEGGGTNYVGAVYQLKAPATKGGAWTERVLYNFKGGSSDGAEPSGRLVFDGKGHLDGVTRLGGPSNEGTVFQLTRQGTSWNEAVLYSFCAQSNCPDGAQPQATLVVDGKGNVYGTTLYGGNCYSCGTVFQLTPPANQGGSWTETVIHNFTGTGGDGNMPVAGLLRGGHGSLWGTTPTGGKIEGECARTLGCGTVFKVLP